VNSLRPSAGLAAVLLVLAALPYVGFHLLARAELRTPVGLSAGGLALPLIAMHMLKVQLPRRVVSSLMLWRQAVPQPSGARPFQRLRRNLPLFLQLLALGALVYALAGPVVGGFAQSSNTQVVVIDVSASMGAVDEPGGATRLERAREQALALLATLEAGGEATVIAVDQSAEVLCPWTGDAQRLRAALEDLHPRAAGTDLAQALRLVAAVAGGRNPDVHVLSDGGGRQPGDVPFPGTLLYHPVGGAPANLGIVATDLKPLGAQGKATHEVYVRVHNAGPARSAFLGLVSGERLLAARAVDLEADQSRAATFRLALPAGIIELRLLADASAKPLRDALAADDRAWLEVARVEPVTARVVSPRPEPHLERGLRAAGAVLSDGVAAQLWVGVDTPLPARGPQILAFAPPSLEGPVSLGPRLDSPELVAWDREHPLLQHVELGELRLERAQGYVLGPRADPLLFARDAAGRSYPIAASYTAGGERRLVFGFDPAESSWPRQVSFPIFLRNVVRWSEERQRGGGASSVRAGSPVSVPLAADSVTLRTPDGDACALPVVDGNAVFDSRRGVGVYRLEAAGIERTVCVNLADPRESAVAARATLDVGARPVAVQEAARTRREVAWWFALAACVILVSETWAYHQRW